MGPIVSTPKDGQLRRAVKATDKTRKYTYNMNKQDSSRRVVITGMGVMSALGTTLDDIRQACREGRSGVRAALETEAYPTTSVAPLDEFTGKIQDFGDIDDAKKKAIRKGLKLMAREIQIGVAAAQRAIADANIADAYPSQRVGVSFASDYIVTTTQELTEAIAACRKTNADGETVYDGSNWRENGISKMTPLWQLKYLTNMSASHITIYNEFYGPAFDMTNRDASFAAALGDAVETIRSGRADAMLVGSTGSRLHPLRLIEAIKNEEIAADVVKERGASEPSVCRPFDARRCGTIPGEGAGAIFIESAEHAQKRGARIYAEVCGGVCRGVLKHKRDIESDKPFNPVESACDLACTEETAREAMRRTLVCLFEKCGVKPSEIGYVNANARGDAALDAAEAKALRDVFGDAIDSIPVTSLKGALGNPGAGAGAIETVAGVLALQEGVVFPTLNYEQADPNCAIEPVASNDVPTGDSFVKLCANNIGQASAALIRRWNA